MTTFQDTPVIAARGPVLMGWGKRSLVRPVLMYMLCVCLLAFSLVHAVVSPHAAAQTTPVPTTPPLSTAAAPIASTPPPATTSGSSAGAAPTARHVAVVPTCHPDTYGGPAALDAAAYADGLTTAVDPPHYYRIYGANSAEVRNQIQVCAPRLSGDSEFTGWTAYRLNWYYAYVGDADNQCTLTSIKVGLHIGQALPNLQLTAGASGIFAAQWRSFMIALATHENGHAVLDKQYAAKLVTDLQALGAQPCDSIKQAATNVINTDVAVLNAANVQYDASTNHGATQGAILP